MEVRKKLLIAYDASDCADDMIIDLRRAGLPPVADVCVLTVEEVWLPVPSILQRSWAVSGSFGMMSAARPDFRLVETPSRRLEEAQAETLDAAKRLRKFFPEWEIEVDFARGSPASAVLSKAAEFGADLIVAGAHGHCGFNRLLLGSVSRKVAGEAGCSVRVTRGHGTRKNGAPSRILIALDGSDAAFAAVDEAANRFWNAGSEARLVVAIDRAESLFESKISAVENDDTFAARDEFITPISWLASFTERARRRLSGAELQISELIEEGDPKQIIVAEAEQWKADCIFIGSVANEKPAVRRSLLGDVSAAVLSQARCSVEIVRAGKAVV